MVGCGLQGANHACFWIVDAAANERAAIGQTEPLRLNVQQGACLHSHDLQALPDVGTHLVKLSLRLAQQVQPASHRLGSLPSLVLSIVPLLDTAVDSKQQRLVTLTQLHAGTWRTLHPSGPCWT